MDGRVYWGLDLLFHHCLYYWRHGGGSTGGQPLPSQDEGDLDYLLCLQYRDDCASHIFSAVCFYLDQSWNCLRFWKLVDFGRRCAFWILQWLRCSHLL